MGNATDMEKAIIRAQEGGFAGVEKHYPVELQESKILLTPAFWQALGNTEGWTSVYHYCENNPEECCAVCKRDGEEKCHHRGNPRNKILKDGTKKFLGGCHHGDGEEWLHHWHRFIDHISEGKDAESFFESLLK